MKAVNLIPTEQRRATASGERKGASYVVLGVLGVLLVMAVAYVVVANSVNERTTAAEEARQEADAYEAQTKNLKSFTDFASIKNQRLAAVMAAAQTRFDWERLMREVAHVMPAGSWLQETTASVAGDAESSTTPASSAAAAVPTGPSATFSGCTPRQSEVAKILVRLRQMHRVSDVELNESVVTPGDNAITLDSCGSFYNFNVTVRFDPAPPVEAPLGSDRVPVSLGGGS
jgi:Tfp pilus assembly protein PilN